MLQNHGIWEIIQNKGVYNPILQMKKVKTSHDIVSHPLSHSFSTSKVDLELESLQEKYKLSDQQILVRKNKLLHKQLELQKQSKKSLQKQLQAYRKVVLKNGDIHEILEMQHQQIFELQTNLQIMQNKYDRLLSSSGSSQQTEYAIKCKQLQNILKNKEMEHQKQIASLKAKMMKMNASQIFESSRMSSELNSKSNTGLVMTPIKNTRKFV